MSKFSYSFRSINEVVRLSRHIHELIEEQSHNNAAQKETIEIVVAGGGPNGVEIAGELAEHIQLVALSHRLDPKVVHIRLVEGMDHIMPKLNKEEAKKIRTRLETLGVTVEEKTTIKEDTPQGLITDKDLIKTRTVIWVAGAKAHHLYTDWNFPTEKNGRVKVTAYLQPSAEQNMENIYIVGDGAQVEGSGQAWPALVQGEIAGRNIYNSIKQRPLVPYVPPEPMMLLPVGYDWVYAKVKGKTYWGTVGSLIRQLHTMKFYFKLLPFNKAWEVIKSGGEMCHSCNICLQNESQKLN
jgi:NADH dehydrogenase